MAFWQGYGCAFYFTSQSSRKTGTIFLYNWRAFSSRGLKQEGSCKYKGPADTFTVYTEERGSDHVSLPDRVLLPVESFQLLRGYNVLKSFQ